MPLCAGYRDQGSEQRDVAPSLMDLNEFLHVTTCDKLCPQSCFSPVPHPHLLSHNVSPDTEFAKIKERPDVFQKKYEEVTDP